jgi:hypothetical protein
MTKLRKWAQGHQAGCQIRLPGCQWGPTIGAHIPSGVRFGKGVGYKPPDYLMALACSSCHDAVDHRSPSESTKTFEHRLLAWYEGFAATLQLMIKDGMVRVK